MPSSYVVLAALVGAAFASPVQQSYSFATTSVPETNDWPLFGGLISITSAKEAGITAQKPYATLNLNLSNSPSSPPADTPAKPAAPSSQPPLPVKKPGRDSDSFFDSATSNLANAPDWAFPFLGFSNPFKAPKLTSDPFADDGYRGPVTASAPSPASAAGESKTGSGSASADDDLWDDGPKTLSGASSVPPGYSVTNPLGADGEWQNGT